MRRRRRASPAVAQARSGGEGAVRRAGAAAGGGERRRPCREADGAGLGAKSKDDDARKLPMRRIEAAFTGNGKSGRRGSSAATAMEVGNGARVCGDRYRSCADKEGRGEE